MNVETMNQTAETVSDLLKILSNKNRLLVLCQLAEEERSVGELAGLLGIREQAMSQQLALLRKDGLVKTRREGQTIFYSLAREDVKKLIEFLYETYCKDKNG
jgi:DNA-binding transcriptional ArsR family regulator